MTRSCSSRMLREEYVVPAVEGQCDNTDSAAPRREIVDRRRRRAARREGDRVPCIRAAQARHGARRQPRIQLPLGYAFLSAERVDGGPDVADRYIAAESQPGDVAVTADIPLAAILVAKGVMVIDPRGAELTPENIGERLDVRDFMDGLRGAGMETGGPKGYGAREKQAFASALDRVLTRAMRGRA